MNTRDIVRKAWQITQVHLKKLIWFGALPAFLSIIVSSVYLAYQYEAFKNSVLFNENPGAHLRSNISLIWGLVFNHLWLSIAAIVISIIILVSYFIIPPIFKGALIKAIARIKNFKTIEGSMEVGVRHFFPMFEFGLLIGSFSVITLFTESSFILRWWGENVFFFILPVLLFIAMVGIVISFLFTYAEYYIIIEDQGLLESIGNSVVMVIANLRKTILVFILMLLIGARVILNVLLILLIPMLIVVLSSYFAAVFWGSVGFALSIIVGVSLSLIGSYLLGLFSVFTTAVWVLTFTVLTEEKPEAIEDIDLGGGSVSLEPVQQTQEVN